MRVHVKTLTGKIINLEVGVDWSIEQLKGAIRDVWGLPPQQYRLVFAVIDYGICDGSILHKVMGLGGGSCYLCMLSCYAHEAKEKIESEEAKAHISLDERASVVGKCSEVLFWLDHGGHGSGTKEEMISRHDALKGLCEPIFAKLAKHKLHAQVLEVKGKMESDEAKAILTVDERAVLVGKCAEVQFWLDEQNDNVAEEEKIIERRVVFEKACEERLGKLSQAPPSDDAFETD